jgi:ATP-binding cassette subfamily F protein uup
VIVVSHDRDYLDRVATSVVVAEGNGRWIEYAGGYSDMVSQRGYGVRAPERAVERTAPRPAAAPVRAAPPRPARLSFKDKHALGTLPAEIARLTAEVARLDGLLADPALYGRDPPGFASASAALARASAELRAAEDRWLELELLREELER